MGETPAAVEAEKIRIDTQKERTDVAKLDDKEMKNEPVEGNEPVKGYLDGVQKAIDASVTKNFGKDAKGAVQKYESYYKQVNATAVKTNIDSAINGIKAENWQTERASLDLHQLDSFPSIKAQITSAATLDVAKSINVINLINKEVTKAKEEADAAQKSIDNGKNVKSELSALAINTVKEKHRAAFDAKKSAVCNDVDLSKIEVAVKGNLSVEKRQQLGAYMLALVADMEIPYGKEWGTEIQNKLKNHATAIGKYVSGNPDPNFADVAALGDTKETGASREAANKIMQNPETSHYVNGMLDAAKNAYDQNKPLYNNYRQYVIGQLAILPENSDFAKVRAAGLLSPTEYARNAGYEVKDGKVTDEALNKTNDWNSAKETSALKNERSVVDGVADSKVEKGMEKFVNNMKDARVKAFFDQQMAEAARMWGGMPDATNRIGWYRRTLVTEICKLDNPANVTGKCTTFRNYMRSADARLKAAPASGGGGGAGGSADIAKSAPGAGGAPAENVDEGPETPEKKAVAAAVRGVLARFVRLDISALNKQGINDYHELGTKVLAEINAELAKLEIKDINLNKTYSVGDFQVRVSNGKANLLNPARGDAWAKNAWETREKQANAVAAGTATAKPTAVASAGTAIPPESAPKPAGSVATTGAEEPAAAAAAKSTTAAPKPAEVVAAPIEQTEKTPVQKARNRVVSMIRNAVSSVKRMNITDAGSVVNNLNIALAAVQGNLSAEERNLLRDQPPISAGSTKLLEGHKFVLTYNPSKSSFNAFESKTT